MTVTSAPIGSTGQSLDGFAVAANVPDAFRESVVLTDPSDPLGAAAIVSTQPIAAYGLPVWMLGTPNVAIAGSVVLAGTSQVFGGVSSFPLGVASTVVVSSVPLALVGTSQIFGQVSTFPTGTVSTQIISSIPFFVAQSSAPWDVRGGVAVTNAPNVNVTNVPAVSITTSIPFFVAQSSAPWNMIGSIGVSSQAAVASSWPLNTTMVNLVSSIPLIVSQSTAIWQMVETVSTAGGTNASTYSILATLNTTVVKGTPGQLYGIMGSNMGSSNVFVRLYNLSTAALTIASTAVPKLVFGLLNSTSPAILFDVGVAFSAGITFITQQQPFTASSSVAPTASTATITLLYQ